MKKIYIGLMLLLLGLIWPGSHVAASNGDRFDIKIQAGFNGQIQAEKGFPVTITIHNNGKDFSGDLVVTIPKNDGSVVNRVIAVELAAGATKNFNFSVSGWQRGFFSTHGPGQDLQQIRLFKGDWQDGNEMKIDPNLQLNPSFLSPSDRVIGELSRDQDALNYFKLLNNSDLIKLDGKKLPADARGLDVLDELVINDYAVSGLPKEVQQAIKEWVYRGGHLIIGGTPGMKQQLGEIAKLFPFSVTGQTTVKGLPEIEKAGGTDLPAQSFAVLTGKLKPGAKVLASRGKLPLVVKAAVGKGKVIQANFDLGNPVFSKWKGSEQWLQSMMVGQITSGNVNRGPNFNIQLSQLSSFFESVTKLPFTGLLILLIIYIIIVLPIAYLLLKRFDKREWSWVVVPGLAVIFSLGLFFYGAKDRLGSVKTHAISVVSLDQNGMGSGKGTVSMLSRGAGDYTMSVKSRMLASPIRTPGPFDQGVSNIPALEQTADGAKIHFQNVEFWSPRSLAVQLPVKDYGGFETHLVYHDGKLTGKITNHSSYSFEKLMILSGNDHYTIGSLKAGETKSVSIGTGSATLFQAPAPGSLRTMYQQTFPPQQKQQKKSEMIREAIRDGVLNVDSPVLFGFTNTPIYSVKVDGQRSEPRSFSLFVQPVSVHLHNGQKVKFNMELQTPELSAIDGSIEFRPMLDRNNVFMATNGTYDLTYHFPESLDGHSYTLKSVTVQLRNGSGVTFQIYDSKKGEFVALSGHTSFVFKKDPEHYVDHRSVRIRVKKPSGHQEIQIPRVFIDGVVKND